MSSNAPAAAREPRQRAEPAPVAGAWDAHPCAKAPLPGGEGQGARPHDHASSPRARRVAATRAGSGTGSRRAPAHVTESMRRCAEREFPTFSLMPLFLESARRPTSSLVESLVHVVGLRSMLATKRCRFGTPSPRLGPSRTRERWSTRPVRCPSNRKLQFRNSSGDGSSKIAVRPWTGPVDRCAHALAILDQVVDSRFFY
jgi:hypothetical protein